MSENAKDYRDPRLRALEPVFQASRRSSKFLPLSQLRKLRDCEQVAAVCYRVSEGRIEFLLVRTSGSGRWTFPKGNAEPGLTHAQAAALEAFEEAGVHGRIEEAAFTRYGRWPNACGSSARKSAERRIVVRAHLCEVLRLGPPQESKRDRTWFSVEEARQRLREERSRADGAALARVIQRAVTRIDAALDGDRFAGRGQRDQPDRQRSGALLKDGLQEVRFDFAEGYGRLQEASSLRQLAGMRKSAVTIVDVPRDVLPCEVLEFGTPKRLSGRRDARP
jgi:8-oxo-dGTP pyrophosphatase MutT (NUDIX family)